MIGRIAVALAGMMLAVLAMLLFGLADPAHADAGAARRELALAQKLLSGGNATAARSHALKAIRYAPDWGAAHVQLADALLTLGEGDQALGELDRAADTGIKGADLAAMRGRALLASGQPQRAIDALAGAGPGHAVEVLRVRGLALARIGDLAGGRDALEAAVARAPKDAGAWTDLGRYRYIAGDLAGAIVAAKQAVALDPNRVQALVLRGELVRQQYGLAAALPWFQGALARDPWDHDALIEAAATLGDMGRTVEMLGDVRRAMQARPDSVRGYYLQAVLAARAGKDALARTILNRIGDAGIDSMPAALMLSGMLDLKAGADQQAADKFGALVDRQPTNITARKLYATALLRIDAAKNAITVLRPVVMRGDADSYSLTLVARALERIGAHDEAGQYLDRAATPVLGGSGLFTPDDSLAELNARASARAPGDPATEIPLIRGLLNAGQAEAALNRARQVAAANPGAPGAQLLVGDVAMLLDQPQVAADAYGRAAALRFDQPTLLRLIEALDAAGQGDRAAKTLALYLAQNPNDVAALRIAAHRQLAAGDADAAIDTLEDLHFRLGNADAALLAELANAYALDGDGARAARYGEAAYAVQPANPMVADAYGWALLTAGDSRGAVQLMEQAVASAPGVSTFRWHLVQALAQDGRKAAALAQLQRLLADPGFADRDAAQALMTQLG